MKVSEMISRLQKIQREYGDLEVAKITDGELDYADWVEAERTVYYDDRRASENEAIKKFGETVVVVS